VRDEGTFRELVAKAGGIKHISSGFRGRNGLSNLLASCSSDNFSDPDFTPARSWKIGRRLWPIETPSDFELFCKVIEQPELAAVPLQMRQ